ncbi:MAG: ribosome-recycling factor [Patescibacteria group bacterium]
MMIIMIGDYIKKLKEKGQELEDWLADSLKSVRTGRATPALLDSVEVEVLGTRSPLRHLASISIEDPKTLNVSPWDPSQVKEVEKAIASANLGVSTSPSPGCLWVIFPDLTTERRDMLIKMIGDKLEEVKISLRKEREKLWNEIQDQAKTGELTEDEKFKLKEDLQKVMSELESNLEVLTERKRKEISL